VNSGIIKSVVARIHQRSHGKIYLTLLILSILVQAFGAICTKFAAEIGSSVSLFGLNAVFLIYCVILGGMGLQVFFWQASLKHYTLSFAYPFRSLVSFIVLLAAFFLFQESVTFFNVLGLVIITVGIFYLVKEKEFLD
jgi:drug/metabolite transporter (DMT)-like permease